MRWHFLLCTKCRAYLREYRRAIELGKAAVRDSDEPLPDEVPRELVEKVMARIDKKH